MKSPRSSQPGGSQAAGIKRSVAAMADLRPAADPARHTSTATTSEQGFLLIALVVAMFLIALFLTITAPTVARSLERDKEVESEHRAQQYVRAIHNYYLKFNAYPTSVEQLLNQNNQHFLRQQYKDPLTGGDYRLIHFGEAKSEVKGFFGEPLQGVAQGSLGALAGNASGIGTGAGGAGASAASGGSGAGGIGTGSAFDLGSSALSSSGTPGSASGANTASSGSFGSGAAPGSSSGSGTGVSATQFQGSKGMIVGVGSNGTGHGMVEWNGSANIEDWEFLYDHRTWLMKQQVSIFGGSIGQSGSGSLSASGLGNTGTAGSGQSPTSPASPGSQPGANPASTGPASASAPQGNP